MKKLTLLLLLMVSTNVMAEWTRVTESEDGEQTVYIDYGTIKKKGHKVKMWVLKDYKTAITDGGYTFLSELGLEEYDCIEETKQTMGFYYFSGNMRGGTPVYSDTTTNLLNPIVLGSISETPFKIACDKK